MLADLVDILWTLCRHGPAASLLCRLRLFRHYSPQQVVCCVPLLDPSCCASVPQVGLWRLLWLPVVPPVFVGLMALACATLSATDADLRRLRAAQYAYKRA